MPTEDGPRRKLFLWNDVHHSLNEATKALMDSTNCSYPEACRIAYEASQVGRAVAFTGTKEQCEKIRIRFSLRRFLSAIE